MKDCGIVKDLLPLYAENLASGESSLFVKNHLEQCADCRAAFDAVKAPVAADPAVPLKSMRKSVKKRGLLIAGLIACLVAALAIGVFARLMKPIPITASEVAFAEATVLPETIPLPAPQAEKAQKTAQPTNPETIAATPEPQSQRDAELEMVKDQQMRVILMTEKDGKGTEIGLIIVPTDSIKEDPESTDAPYTSIGYTLVIPEKTENRDGGIVPASESPKTAEKEPGNPETVAYVYNVPDTDEAKGQTLEPEAVIVSTPKTLKLTPKWDTFPLIERTGNEISIGAYTTLWDMRHPHAETPQEIDLSGVDAVFFEPYNNTEREILYQREGYTPEAGFALPRLVMNYYFLIALIGTVLLAVVWFVLRLLKKEKARRVFDVLLLIAGSGVLAFLFAGFPATTIAPVRELLFVVVIALLLVGAGLCGRKLLRKE